MLTCSPSPSSSSLNKLWSTVAMDSSSNRPSPRSLQGPRPSPLKVRKDSHKITKKTPVIPHNSNPPPNPQQQQPQPLIIYSVSPKIIHTNPSDFMSLVQQLTGTSPKPNALSPAARFAAIEKATSTSSSSPRGNHDDRVVVDVGDASCGGGGEMLLDPPTSSTMPGILSPMPSALQPISSSFFSPITAFDIPGSMSFLNEIMISPGSAFGGCGNLMMSPSPGSLSNLLLSPSPGSYWDLFGQYQDL